MTPIRIKVDPSHDASKVKAEGPGLSRSGKETFITRLFMSDISMILKASYHMESGLCYLESWAPYWHVCVWQRMQCNHLGLLNVPVLFTDKLRLLILKCLTTSQWRFLWRETFCWIVRSRLFNRRNQKHKSLSRRSLTLKSLTHPNM